MVFKSFIVKMMFKVGSSVNCIRKPPLRVRVSNNMSVIFNWFSADWKVMSVRTSDEILTVSLK